LRQKFASLRQKLASLGQKFCVFEAKIRIFEVKVYISEAKLCIFEYKFAIFIPNCLKKLSSLLQSSHTFINIPHSPYASFQDRNSNKKNYFSSQLLDIRH
jgi:hypothetical protein